MLRLMVSLRGGDFFKYKIPAAFTQLSHTKNSKNILAKNSRQIFYFYIQPAFRKLQVLKPHKFPKAIVILQRGHVLNPIAAIQIGNTSFVCFDLFNNRDVHMAVYYKIVSIVNGNFSSGHFVITEFFNAAFGSSFYLLRENAFFLAKQFEKEVNQLID